MKKFNFLSFLILMAFFLILVSGFCFCGCSENKKEIEWKNLGTGKWIATNNTCLEKSNLEYLCKADCYEKSETEIWNFCQDEGSIKTTDTGIEVLCFENSCMPKVINETCNLVCPL